VRHCADSRHTVLVVGQQGVACDGKECSTYASSARRWVSLMMRLERAIVAARRLSREECLQRVGSLTRVGLKWRMSCGSGRTLDVGDMQPIRQAVSPGALLGSEVAPTQAQARACSRAPALAPHVDNNPHHQQQARREGCGAMASATSNALADAVPASLFTSTTFEKDVSIFVDDEIGAASISPSGRDVVLAR
jgi:hypothetical protein